MKSIFSRPNYRHRLTEQTIKEIKTNLAKKKIMTPKEKAEQLIKEFSGYAASPDGLSHRVNCCYSAIILCKEAKIAASTTLKIVDKRKENQGIDDIIDTDDILFNTCVPYWDAVINELTNEIEKINPNTYLFGHEKK